MDSLEAQLDRDWSKDCGAVVSTVTGLSVEDGSDLSLAGSEQHQRMESYQAWLTKQFRFNLRPYQFIFPNSVRVHNETKEEALEKMRQKKEGDKFDVTTRNKAVEQLKSDLDKTNSAVAPTAEFCDSSNS